MEFSLLWDETVCLDPEARVVGYVLTVNVEEGDLLKSVPQKFREYLNIMGKEAADT